MPTLIPNQKVRVRFVNYDDFPANCIVQSVKGNVARLIQHEASSRRSNCRGWYAPIFLRFENGHFYAIDLPLGKTVNPDFRVEILNAY